MHHDDNPPRRSADEIEAALAQSHLEDLRLAEINAITVLKRWGVATTACVCAVGAYAVYELGPGGLVIALLAAIFSTPTAFFAWIPYDAARTAREVGEKGLEDVFQRQRHANIESDSSLGIEPGRSNAEPS